MNLPDQDTLTFFFGSGLLVAALKVASQIGAFTQKTKDLHQEVANFKEDFYREIKSIQIRIDNILLKK